jgi:adenylate kinase
MMRMKKAKSIPKIIIITGTPGTGKTTVSRIISKNLDINHIELSKLAKEQELIKEKDPERETYIIDKYRLEEKLDEILKNSLEPVIIDGHYAHDYIPFKEDVMVFVFRRAPWLLFDELKSRGYSRIKTWENLEAEIMGVCMNEAQEKHKIIYEINTTTKKPEEVAKIIQELIKGKNSFTTISIDWLTYPCTIELLKGRH